MTIRLRPLVAAIAVFVVAGATLGAANPAVAATAPSIPGCVGAQALDPASPAECMLQETYAGLVPVKGVATTTVTIAESRKCRVPSTAGGVKMCVFGVASPKNLKIAVVGDSHAEQWIPAIDAVADREKWRVETFLKGGCPFSTVMRTGLSKSVRDKCKSWNLAVVRKLAAGKFDVIITTHASGRPFATRGTETSIEAETRGVTERWASVARSSKATIVAIRDSPVLAVNPHSCLNALGSAVFARSFACTSTREVALRPDASSRAAEGTQRPVIDLSNWFCDASRCFGMVGAVRVYRDASHMSGLYSKTLAPYMEAEIRDALVGL